MLILIAVFVFVLAFIGYLFLDLNQFIKENMELRDLMKDMERRHIEAVKKLIEKECNYLRNLELVKPYLW